MIVSRCPIHAGDPLTEADLPRQRRSVGGKIVFDDGEVSHGGIHHVRVAAVLVFSDDEIASPCACLVEPATLDLANAFVHGKWHPIEGYNGVEGDVRSWKFCKHAVESFYELVRRSNAGRVGSYESVKKLGGSYGPNSTHMKMPYLRLRLTGNVIHVHLGMRYAATAVGLSFVRGGAMSAYHERGYEWRAAVGWEDDGVERGHTRVGRGHAVWGPRKGVRSKADMMRREKGMYAGDECCSLLSDSEVPKGRGVVRRDRSDKVE